MTTIRVRFSKCDEAAYISLLDLQRIMQRAFKRSHLPVWYTLGFNPHIYMTFATPLALGQESLCEVVDFKTEADSFDWSAKETAQQLQECLPKGIAVCSIAPAQTNPEAIVSAVYAAEYEPQDAEAARAAFAAFAALPHALVEKKGKRNKSKTIDLQEYVTYLGEEPTADGFTMKLCLPAGNTFNVNPVLLTNYLEQQYGLPSVACRLLRLRLLQKDGKEFV